MGVTNGRKKLGSIFVVAAGNGGSQDDCNYDGFANSVYTLTIGMRGNTYEDVFLLTLLL